MCAVAQHDHHDQLSTAWLMDTEMTDHDAVPTVSGHYVMVSI